MSHSFSKEELNKIFNDIAKELKKGLRGKNFSYELIVVGGASILLNYSFRETTIDIDCLDVNDALMNDIVNKVSDKYNLPNDFINTDFLKTRSYTPKLVQYSSFYKRYCNGALVVRTIKDEYLIAMKMVSGRKYKHDLSDIFGIIKGNSTLNYAKIEEAVKNLYGNKIEIDKEVVEFVKDIFNNTSLEYSDISKEEQETGKQLIEQIKKKNTY